MVLACRPLALADFAVVAGHLFHEVLGFFDCFALHVVHALGLHHLHGECPQSGHLLVKILLRGPVFRLQVIAGLLLVGDFGGLVCTSGAFWFGLVVFGGLFVFFVPPLHVEFREVGVVLAEVVAYFLGHALVPLQVVTHEHLVRLVFLQVHVLGVVVVHPSQVVVVLPQRLDAERFDLPFIDFGDLPFGVRLCLASGLLVRLFVQAFRCWVGVFDHRVAFLVPQRAAGGLV